MTRGLPGESNPQWRGDNVGYSGVHRWARINLPKPDSCSKCGQVKKLEVCNISGKYLRDLEDWEYLCRVCHMKSDGRMNNLVQHSPPEIRSAATKKAWEARRLR